MTPALCVMNSYIPNAVDLGLNDPALPRNQEEVGIANHRQVMRADKSYPSATVGVPCP
jgi:hypothetical protein